MNVQRKLSSVLATTVAVKKAIINMYSECVSVTLGKQPAKRMGRVIQSSVVCLALQYFLRYFMNGTIFNKKKLLNIISVLIFDVFFCHSPVLN
jgi:hypothetical protein